jgi:DNA-binding response OmpR family regulator
VASAAAVESAALAAPSSDSRLCSKLLEAGADEGDLVGALAERFGVPGVDLSRSVLDLEVVDDVPRAVAETDHILPLSTEGGRLHLAVASPDRSERVLAEVRFVTGREVSIYVAVLAALRGAIAGCYGAREAGGKLWRGARATEPAPRLAIRPPAPIVDEDLPELSDEELVSELPPEGAAEREVSTELVIEAGDPGPEEVVHAVSVWTGPRRVLVVDDEAAIRLLAQRALEHRGHAVETASDGLEALARAQASVPDLVLLDAMLPKLHGFEVARRLRSDPATRRIPVVIMTAVYRGWRFAKDARESFGAHDYIEKPFRVDELVRRVDAVLESAAREAPPAAGGVSLEPARAAAAAGRLDEAIEAFEAAAQADPFSAEAHAGLGEAYLARGDAFAAMTSLERAVELEPALFGALKRLAAIYLSKGFRAKAAETLERAASVAPDTTTREALRAELMKLL